MSAAPQFFCTAPNDAGIKFYVRKPPVVIAAPPVDEKTSSADAAAADAATAEAAALKRVTPRDLLLKQLEENKQMYLKIASDLASFKARYARSLQLTKSALDMADKKLKSALDARDKKRLRRSKAVKASSSSGAKSGLMLYSFVDAKLAKFLGIDENTCVRRQDITSFYSAYVNQHGLKTLVDVEGKKKPVTRTRLDDNLRELLGAENVAKIESGEVVLTPILFNKFVHEHYRGHAPDPSAAQDQEINSFRSVAA